MLLVADHSVLVTQRWDIRVGTSQGPRTLITLKCLDTSILNTDENHLITLTPTGHLAVAQNFTAPSQHSTMMQRHALVSLLLCAVIALFQVSSALSQSMSSYAGKYNLQFAAQNSVVQSIPPGRTISLSMEQLPDDSNMYRLSIKVANILMSSFKIISTNENGEETIKCGPGKLCFIFCFRFSVFYEFSSIPCST
jgi:hypothetical protein